jgi:transcription antitermination factor NusG
LKQKTEYFTRFPNDYIQGNIKTKYGVSRKFYITYILIDKYRSYEDYSWITIRKVLEFYGYKTTKHKPKAFHEILDVLEYMINNKMIEVKQDLDSVGYDTGIEIKIIPGNFDATDKFSKITSSQLDFIMMNESSINKENILMAFLYINSYIFIRQRDNNGNELIQNPKEKPEAFWRSIESMSKELSMSKDTINQCIQYLTSSIGDQKPLLIKKEVGSIQPDPKKPPQNIPNIYVLNKEGYEQEIEWAIAKMLEIYNVDYFGELKGGNKN